MLCWIWRESELKVHLQIPAIRQEQIFLLSLPYLLPLAHVSLTGEFYNNKLFSFLKKFALLWLISWLTSATKHVSLYSLLMVDVDNVKFFYIFFSFLKVQFILHSLSLSRDTPRSVIHSSRYTLHTQIGQFPFSTIFCSDSWKWFLLYFVNFRVNFINNNEWILSKSSSPIIKFNQSPLEKIFRKVNIRCFFRMLKIFHFVVSWDSVLKSLS